MKQTRVQKLTESVEFLRESIIDIQAKCDAAYARGDEKKGKEIDGHITILHGALAKACAELHDSRTA